MGILEHSAAGEEHDASAYYDYGREEAGAISHKPVKFPRTSRELNRMFRNASDPVLSDLEGEYLVDMLTIWPSFKRFFHRKIFYRENNKLLGHNVLMNVTWGRFFVEEDVCKDADSIKVAVINYSRPENLFHVRPVRDHIRCVEKGIHYIGRFNYLMSGRLIFLGYFSLEKIDLPLFGKEGLGEIF